MVEEARLESVYTPKGYPGFESPSLRREIDFYKGIKEILSKEANYFPKRFEDICKKFTFVQSH